MARSTPVQLVEKAVQSFEQQSKSHRRAPSSHPRVITISRQLGSGGRRVAQQLGETLGWPVWDREILDVVANQSNMRYQARMFEALDEKAQSSINALADSLLGSVDRNVYLHLLPRAVLIIAQNDGIILGRGAHLLLPAALRVRVVASLDTRVRNLMQYEGLTEETARRQMLVSDQERESFIRLLASRLRPRPAAGDLESHYDLVINTDTFGIAGSANMILEAADLKLGMKAAA